LICGILFDYGNTLVRIKNEQAVLKEVLAELGHEIDDSDAFKGMGAFKEYWHKNYEGFRRGQRWTEEIRVRCVEAALSTIGFGWGMDRLASDVAGRTRSLKERPQHNGL